MKKFIALGFGCLLAQGAMAQDEVIKVLPALPEGCEDQIANNGLYCSANVITSNKTTVTFATIVSKDALPTVDAILARYASFDRWPEFADVSQEKVIEFARGGSKALSDLTNADGTITKRHVYEYSLKIQGIPFLKQAVKGTTYNTIVSAYEGALASLEFEARANAADASEVAPKGLKSQVGSIHALACDPEILAACDENKWLLVYETTVQPEVSFAMSIAANTVTAGIEDLLIGMLDESIVDPIVIPPVVTPVVTPVEEAPVEAPSAI